MGFRRTELSWDALRAINPKPLEVADFCKAPNSIWACEPCFVLFANSASAKVVRKLETDESIAVCVTRYSLK